MAEVYTLGVDVGSTASKCVILRDGREIVALSLVPYGAGSSGPGRAIEEVLEKAGKTTSEMAGILATGYGRKQLAIAEQSMSELSCHARGAHFLFPRVRSVIDIGGQDVKILSIGSNGMLENFVMNDKCAAGTGRFLDVMAHILELRTEELADYAERAQKEIVISSTCTVFAESEVISQLAAGCDKADLIRGICVAIASKVAGLARRIGVRDELVMTGGVAHNRAVRNALAEALGHPIKSHEYCQHVGALGAALIAWQRCHKLAAENSN